MAGLGVGLSGLLAAVGGAVLLARLLRASQHPWAGSLAGAVFSVADIASGRTTFAIGAVAALAALVALPHRRAAGWAVLTALLSPVAAAFLGLAAAVLVLHRRPGGWPVGLGAALPVVLLTLAFPAGGVQPYAPSSAVWPVLAGLALAALTTSVLLRTGALLYAALAAGLVLSHDPFGSNVLRLGLLLATPLVVATSARSRLVLAPVAVALLGWQADPTVSDLRAPAGPSFSALDRELVRLGAQRVEVVPLRDHQEAAVTARVVPLARGWSRQVDRDLNGLFYVGELSPQRYLAWLLEHHVGAVALSRTLTDTGGVRERRLLSAGPVPGLEPVWADRTWTVWRVAGAGPLADPPAQVLASRRASLMLRSDRPVEVAVDVRWSRWLSLTGPGCLRRDGDRTRVRFRGPGTVTVGSSLLPGGRC